jgi:hypothetical protein
MAKKYSIIYQYYLNLTDAVKKFQDNWMSYETCFSQPCLEVYLTRSVDDRNDYKIQSPCTQLHADL